MISKNKTKLFTLIIMIALAITLTGCTQEETAIATENGGILTYTKDEASKIGGFFIKKGEDEYQALLSASIRNDMGTFVWHTDFDPLIPEIKSDKEKVVFMSYVNRPEIYEFTEMKDMGYTLGVAFEQRDVSGSEDPEYTFNLNLTNRFSPAGEYLKNTIGDTNNIKIDEVNGREFKGSMLTSEGFMKGLTKNSFYKFWYYEGTHYESISLLADSKLYLPSMSYYSDDYIEKKDKYFEVNIPKEMGNGYYIVEGGGMFKYNVPAKGSNK